MVKWTDDQKNAFESRNQNLLLSAAAGSGKTAVLVKRIISLVVNDHIPIDQMLIITFTKAAAGEMRERIMEALSDAIDEKGADRRFIRKQISMLNNANISTIHAFCMEVIKRNFHNINLDPAFRILDSTEKELIFVESINEVLEKEYEKENDEFINLVESYTSNRGDNELIKIIDDIYRFIRSKPEPIKWLEEKAKLYNISKDQINNHIWIKAFGKIMIRDLELSKKYLKEAKLKCDSVCGPLEYKEAIDSDLVIVEELKGAAETNIEKFFDMISEVSYKRLGRISKDRKKEIDTEIQDLVKNLRKKSKDNLKKIITKIGDKSFNEQIDDLKRLFPLIKYLIEIIKEVDKSFILKKSDKNALDFSDLEQYALELLRDEKVSQIYREKFEYIFVDEYQDTNVIQEEMVNLIKRKDNLFLVGDVKQSIYKFRLAEPELFLNKYHSFSLKNNANNRKINLSKNFRTRVEILDGINFIFQTLMSEDFGEIDYDKNAFLYKGLDFEKSNQPNIELNIINSDKKTIDEDEVEEDLLELKASEIEAKAIVQRIKKLVGEKTYDKKLKNFREIEYRDIVILMRATNIWGSVFEEVFLKEGIPLYYEGGTGYLKTLEIEMFLNLLRVIDNKRNDIPLLSVMRSPIGKFSIKEIIEIRLKYPNKKYFNSLDKMSKTDSFLGYKSKNFIDKIEKWQEMSKYNEIDEFIEKLLIETNYLNYISAMPGGNLRRGNLKLLVQKAKDFSESSITGLFYFIRFIEKIDNISGDFDTANVISESENVVRLMSIHKSKGLEFPVVIIARGNRQIRSMESKNNFVLHKDYGIGVKYIDHIKRMKSETISRLVINQKIKYENLAEEMRILYVAMTRSVDKLLIYGTYNRGFLKRINEWTMDNSKEFLKSSKSYMDWIMKIVSNNKEGKKIYEIAEKDFYNDGNDLFNINILDLTDIEEAEIVEAKEISRIKDKLVRGDIEVKEDIDNIFSFKYDKIQKKSPTKVSVTDLKTLNPENIEAFKLFNNIPQMQKEPNFVVEKAGLSPFDIGNTYHYIMEKMDLSKVEIEEIENQLNYLLNKGYINEMQRDILDVESIYNFYKSNVGKKLINSNYIRREVPFTYKYQKDLLVQGIIDIYFEENNELIIIDYKTDKINSSNEELLVKEHKKQLELYSLALEDLTGKKVSEKYLYFFRNNSFYKV